MAGAVSGRPETAPASGPHRWATPAARANHRGNRDGQERLLLPRVEQHLTLREKLVEQVEIRDIACQQGLAAHKRLHIQQSVIQQSALLAFPVIAQPKSQTGQDSGIPQAAWPGSAMRCGCIDAIVSVTLAKAASVPRSVGPSRPQAWVSSATQTEEWLEMRLVGRSLTSGATRSKDALQRQLNATPPDSATVWPMSEDGFQVPEPRPPFALHRSSRPDPGERAIG